MKRIVWVWSSQSNENGTIVENSVTFSLLCMSRQANHAVHCVKANMQRTFSFKFYLLLADHKGITQMEKRNDIYSHIIYTIILSLKVMKSLWIVSERCITITRTHTHDRVTRPLFIVYVFLEQECSRFSFHKPASYMTKLFDPIIYLTLPGLLKARDYIKAGGYTIVNITYSTMQSGQYSTHGTLYVLIDLVSNLVY